MSTAEEAIRRLIGLYFRRVDEKDVEGIVIMFPENGRLDIRGNVNSGRAEMRTFLTDLFASSDPNVRGMHIVSAGQLVDVDGNTATAVTDVMVMRLIEKVWTPALVNTHFDKLALQGDGWVFVEKRVVPVG